MKIVTIFIKNKNNQFLIQKRSIKKNGKYGFTSGHMNINETKENAAIREVKEELGIELSKEQLKMFYETEINKNNYYLYYIINDVNINTLKLQKEEVENVNWYYLNEIEEMINNGEFFETQIEALEQFKKYIGG